MKNRLIKIFSKKQGAILIILVIVLVGCIFLFRERFQRWPWEKFSGLVSPTATPEISISTSVSPSASPEENAPRTLVMNDVAKRIGELSPVEPVLGGKWYVLRYWFVDGSYSTFYVEYEDGHIMRKILLTADLSKAPEKIGYKVDAYFEPGESDWVLKTGKDQKSTLPLILFEYVEAQKNWLQKN